MRIIIKIIYYLCFGWLIILVVAELGALVVHDAMLFSSFLGIYFFSWITYFAMGFVLARFLVIMVADVKTKFKSI